VYPLHVDQIRNVATSVVHPHVRVCRNSLETLQTADQNVPRITTVRVIWLASGANVKILAQELAESVPNVSNSIISQYACVLKATLAILSITATQNHKKLNLLWRKTLVTHLLVDQTQDVTMEFVLVSLNIKAIPTGVVDPNA
jgi:hypothetical protein